MVEENDQGTRLRRSDQTALVRSLAGGRLSLDSANTFTAFSRIVAPPINPDDNWRVLSLDSKTLDRISPRQLTELLTNISPEVSRALWDFLRMCNPGFEILAFQPGSDTPYPEAQKLVDAFLMVLEDEHGSVDVPIARSFLAVFMRGAFLNELVLDGDGRMPLDLATPDPWSVRFKQVPDEVRRFVWQMGQWQFGKFEVLDRPTIRYVPIDPFPGSMYGRPMAAPALFTAVFLLVMLHDVRRVVQQQGMPRIDISINLEALEKSMPDPLIIDNDAKQAWVDAVVAQVQGIYRTLEPDDAYVHTDVVDVNRPVGTVDSDSLGGIDKLIESLTRMLVRALKTMPLLMAMTDGVSEANANRQWEIHAAGIKALQHTLETVLRRLIKLGLQAQGVIADVTVQFAELRNAELIRDAQAQQIIQSNDFALYFMGLIDHEELAMRLVKRKAAAEAPIMIPTGWSMGGSGGIPANPDPGANRALPLMYLVREPGAQHEGLPPGYRIMAYNERSAFLRDSFQPNGTLSDLPDLPSVGTAEPFTAGDKERIQSTWDELHPEYATLLDAQVLEDEARSRSNGVAH